MGDQRTTDARLHAYFDGELSPSEAAEVREQLEADPALRAKLGGLGEVRALVRASVARAEDEVPSDDLWARIEARIAEAAPAEEADPEPAIAPRPGLRVIPGGVVEGGSPSSSDEARPGAGAPVPLDPHRRRRLVGVVIAGLALAAAVLLLVLRPGDPPGGVSPEMVAEVDPSTGDPDVAPEPSPESAEELVFRTEVLEVDFGDNSGAVFSVEGDDGQRYAVVWLADVQPKRTSAEQ